MQFQQEQLALGSVVQISLVARSSQSMAIDALFSDLWKQAYTFERQFSRFLPQSELSFFNRQAGSKQRISPEFKKILTAARDISLAVDGLYNPFILPALQAAGYGASLVKGHEHDMYDDFANRKVVPIEKLEIGDSWAKIPQNSAIDLGGCGKGYLADQLADSVTSKVKGYWISLGGDVVFGGVNAIGQPWQINVLKARSETKPTTIAKVQRDSKAKYAVATSGTTARYGVKQGKLWHHLIDPRTLQPAETDILTATVCAPSGLLADVLASCAVILGSEQAIQFLKQQGVSSALLQCRSSKEGDYNVHYGKIIKLDV